MKLERVRPGVVSVTLHAYELAALVAAARWAAEGAEGEIPEEATEELRRVLDSYDREMEQLER